MALKPVNRWLVPTCLFLLGSLPILTGAFSLISTAEGIAESANIADDFVTYVQNPWPIFAHIIAGSLFNILGPFQFMSGLRSKHPKLHRWTGRMFILSGLVSAFSAVYMNQLFPQFGGQTKYWSNLIFSVAVPVCLAIAVYAIVTERNIAKHRAFMMRAYAIGLGVATQRLILMPYFLMFGIPLGETLGALLIVCWCINLAVVEWILRSKSFHPNAMINRT